MGASEQLKEMTGEEEILWRKKPAKIPLLIINSLKYFGIALIVIFTVSMLFFAEYIIRPLFEATTANVFSVNLIVVYIIPVILLMAISIGMAWLNYEKSEYAVTEKRLIQFGGVIGRDYSAIRWKNIQDLEVNIGVLDKIFGVGGITARTAGMSDSSSQGILFNYLPKVYKETKQLERIQNKYED